MALAYTPPGVNVEELYSPSVSPLLAVSASVCLVGRARGYETGVAQATFAPADAGQVITAPAGTVLQTVATNQLFDSVVNVLDPTAGSNADGSYAQGTDFQVTLATDNTSATIVPVAATALETNGGTLQFSYRYVPADYYIPIRLDSQSAVEARFGPAFDSNGIVTPLSAAAALAFENGAASVVVQPLIATGDVQPNDVQAADENTWDYTLSKLHDIEDVNVVVPIVGQSNANVDDAALLRILFKVQDYARYMLTTEGQYVVSIFGEDSSGSTADAALATIRDHANQLRARYNGDLAEQTVVVSPSRFTRSLPSSTSATVLVGGQYVAAAIAGMLAARPVQQPLTRKQVSGFSSVAFPNYDKASKNADAQAGLLVVEQKGAIIQVRHGVTLNNTDTAKRELSVIRAKHRMIASVRQTLEEQVIGTVPADGNAPHLVQVTIISVLEQLRNANELVAYSSVETRLLTNDPTTVEARFSYLPAFPLNYVRVVFSLDLTGGDVTTTTTTAAV